MVFWHKLLLTHANRIIRKFYGVKKMMKKGLVLIVLAVFAIACAPSAAAVQRAIQQTQAALPTTPPTEMPTQLPTPTTAPTIAPPAAPTIPQVETSVPVILGHSEDLPAEYRLGSLGSIPDDRFTWITDRGTTNHLLSIEKGDDGVMAYVAVFEYEDDITPIYAYMDDLDEVTRLVQEYGTTYTFNFNTTNEVGDKDLAYIMSAESDSEESIAVGFVRCNLYVRVSFADTTDRDLILGYAKNLDKRFLAIGCD